MIRKILFVVLSSLSLGLYAADYNYLMTHPKQLASAYQRCQQVEEDSTCLQVVNAAQDFIKLVADRRDHPQNFGKLILTNQMLLGKLDEKLQQLPQTHPQYSQTRLAYDNQLQKVNTLLSVVAATSM